MAQIANVQASGAYTYDQIVATAEASFPDAYNALPDVDDMPWDRPDYDRGGFSPQ